MADGHVDADERLVVALVRGVHGLHGAVRVEVLTDAPERRFRAGSVLYREGTSEPLTIASAAAVQDGPGWRLRFREVETREAADTLRNAYLETVVRPDADLARGEVYWHEVVGTPVRGVDGTELGVVQDVYRVAENEVYVVGGGVYGTFDVPGVRAFVRIFAPRRGEIVVDAAALDLRPPKARVTGDDRPRAPRRTSPKRRRSSAAASEAAGATDPTDTEASGGPPGGPEGAADGAASADGPPDVTASHEPS